MNPIQSILASLLLCSAIFGQASGDSRPHVVFKHLVPPIYPGLANVAHIAGDVSLKVSIHTDGTLEAVTPISGDRLLMQASVESAKQSQFECRNCDGLTEKSLVYTFKLPAEHYSPDP